MAAQQAARAPRDVVVSSQLERIVAPAADEAAAQTADQLVVSVHFKNASEHVVDSIRITSPVPAGVQYVPHSASGPGSEMLFSVDNGRSFGRPGELTLTASDGSVRSANPTEYTHVRWVLRAPLDAGAEGVARFLAVPR